MIIKKSNHKIVESNNVNIGDVPLAYIDTDDTTLEAVWTLHDDFVEDKKELVRAYDEFDNDDIFFFDGDRNLKDVVLQRRGNTFLYEPSNLIEFTPTQFNCQVLIKKNMTFKDDKIYNLKIGAIEGGDTFDFSSKLISVFGNAYKRGICPPNIVVNNGTLLPQSLLDCAGNDSDFIFVESTDGVELYGLNVDSVLQKHVNIWISAEAFGEMFKDKDFNPTVQEGNLSSFYVATDRVRLSDKVFNKALIHSSYPESTYTYTYPYEDVLILEKKNGGFIVVTPKDFIDNIADNVKVFYDVMMYVFLKSYYSAQTIYSWITDKPIDYMAYNKMLINAYHKRINLAETLKNDRYDIEDEYNLISITPSSDKVAFISLDSDKNMIFRKVDNKSDPEKKDGCISYLSFNDTVLLYRQEEVYLTRTRADISYRAISKNDIRIIINPIVDSYNHIYAPEAQEIKVPDITKQYYLCTLPTSQEITSVFNLIDMDSYDMETHGIIIADVKIKQNTDIKVIDMRTPGGGLPIKEKNDYNMIDIGNIYGRPYRIGSTMIITLPKRYEAFKDRIKEQVEQHMAAGDYPILLFKD